GLEPLPQQSHLRVVRGDDKNVVRGHRVHGPLAVDPLSVGAQEGRRDALCHFDLLRRGVLVPLVRNGDDPETRPLEWGGPDEYLSLQAGAGPEPPLVEHLRREGADAGRQPPAFGQEDPALTRNGLASIEDVLERRRVGPLWMAS